MEVYVVSLAVSMERNEIIENYFIFGKYPIRKQRTKQNHDFSYLGDGFVVKFSI